MVLPRVLTIAGSAAQGSAGIQADLKTFQERDVYGMAVVTAIVAKNPVTESSIFTSDLEAVEAQFHAANESVGFDAVKTGMLFTKEIIEKTAELLSNHTPPQLVVDPVMIGKMGSQLLRDDAIEAMKERIFPLASLITPNLHEAEKILDMGNINTLQAMKEAAKELHEFGPDYVLVKGGALKDSAVDVLYDGKDFMELPQERIDTIHTSGAGCSYSAAIAAELAKGQTMEQAVTLAKAYVTYAIKHALSFGRGIGSTYHAAYRKYADKHDQ
ncbi:bifunctional hydroxymethylpyrimidine kinase/phosphomethylpyrimidine kinase [Sediminibacillus massiliensis]|uniref:bifunctional hydroxymethylpyrimidine kinase/phosphomethylpyrimidine kinase n=1 Tax=Sediminibacillus massiliensis TaxID=1926277 RepID=UPI0009884200|nr:bifunctional hydroxymethylpyrimidine kinase/phosphomethylpyrimidine kinase [Sediminibacillus massiliensis]